jgi:hypothetical protein
MTWAKSYAVSRTRLAIEMGRLCPQPCEECGTDRNVVGHHDDYAKPDEVRWLCQSHHRRWHNANGPGANAHRPKPVRGRMPPRPYQTWYPIGWNDEYGCWERSSGPIQERRR